MPARSYGPIFRTVEPTVVPNIPMAASAAFKALGGKFVTWDGTSTATISVAGDTQIFGWAAVNGDLTTSATAGADKVAVITDLNCVFELPSDAVFTAAQGLALIQKTCDLVVNSTIQQADIGASSTDVLKIVGFNVTDQTVYVTINPAKYYTAGVA